MRFDSFTLILLIGSLLFSQTAIAADQSTDSNSRRWGITPKMSVEAKEDAEDDTKKKETDSKQVNESNLKEKRTTVEEKASGNSATESKVVNGNIKNSRKNLSTEKITEQNQSEKTVPRETKNLPTNEIGDPSGRNNRKEAMFHWKNKSQKDQCNAYLVSLKESFLKARYYSIQGVPCGTAENSRVFMKLIAECKRDCPDGFLKRNGYTLLRKEQVTFPVYPALINVFLLKPL